MKKVMLMMVVFFGVLPAVRATDVAVTVKQHREHSKMSERPFGKGDLSYGLFMEFLDGPGGWRIGAAYANDVSGPLENIDRVITPEITLFLLDEGWEAGISVLKDYITDDEDSDWGSTYFQMQLGYNFPMGRTGSIGIHTFYPFEGFGDLGSFRFSDLDFGITARFRF